MSLRQFLICAIVLSAFVAVYSLEDAAVAKDESSTDKVQDLIEGSASDMARRRKHRFGHHLCKKMKRNDDQETVTKRSVLLNHFLSRQNLH